MDERIKKIRQVGIVPVIRINNPDNAVPLAKALDEGGIPIAEITFRTEHAAEAIRRIREEVPELLVGAGTVLTKEQVDAALAAGAEFVVTPGFNPAVVDYALEKGCMVLPGAPSVSDIERAMERGLRVVKCFPAEALGGLAYIKAVSAPYADMLFMPTGGITPRNINDYLAYNRVIACGGSWMVDQKKIEAGDYAGITRLCREAVDTVLGLQISGLTLAAGEGRCAEDEKILYKLFSGGDVGPRISVADCKSKTGRNRLTITCNNLERAVFHLARRGVAFDYSSKSVDDAGRNQIFLWESIDGLDVCLSER